MEPLTLDTIITFSVYGIMANAVILATNVLITTCLIFGLSSEDRLKLMYFSTSKKEFIEANNSYGRILANNCTFLLPVYSATLGIIYMYWLCKGEGLMRIVNATIKSERFSIVPLLNYKIVLVNK